MSLDTRRRREWRRPRERAMRDAHSVSRSLARTTLLAASTARRSLRRLWLLLRLLYLLYLSSLLLFVSVVLLLLYLRLLLLSMGLLSLSSIL